MIAYTIVHQPLLEIKIEGYPIHLYSPSYSATLQTLTMAGNAANDSAAARDAPIAKVTPAVDDIPRVKGLKDFPAEILLSFMESMPSPLTLLHFLDASPYTHALFRRFHREILSRVLIAEAPARLVSQLSEEEPLCYRAALSIARQPRDPDSRVLHVPKLEEPMITLMSLVLAAVPEKHWNRKCRRTDFQLEKRGADQVLRMMYLGYWMQRLNEEEATEVVGSYSASS